MDEEKIEEAEENYFVEATPEISNNDENGGPAFVLVSVSYICGVSSSK